MVDFIINAASPWFCPLCLESYVNPKEDEFGSFLENTKN